MHIDKASFERHPEKATDESYDCVWVRFSARKSPSPLKSEVLQWIDWKLQGSLSRFLLDKAPERTTFLPSRDRLGAPLVALEPVGAETDWEQFARNCEGLGLKKILLLCEETAEVSRVERSLKQVRLGGVEQVVLGADSLVEHD
ncbi:hypothetical protein K2X33_13075 [bacterium]|nr:hypothetical protein [bacterium]